MLEINFNAGNESQETGITIVTLFQTEAAADFIIPMRGREREG